MDGRLLILCDEFPGEYEHYSIKDFYYLKEELENPYGYPERVFASWETIFPSDKTFLNFCHYYARTFEVIPPDFFLQMKGIVDPQNGNIGKSLQEESFMKVLESNYERVRTQARRGEDYRAEMMELVFQYAYQATQQVIDDFSSMLERKNIIRILPAHKKGIEEELKRERTMHLEAWQQYVKLVKKETYRDLVEPLDYDEFGEVISRSSKEMMKIYSLPFL